MTLGVLIGLTFIVWLRDQRRPVSQPIASQRLDVEMHEGWASRGPGGGGALFAPEISPHDASEIFLASDMGSMLVTKTFGRSWETLPFRRLEGDSHTQVRYCASPAILYAIDAAQRLVKSDDSGATWRASVAQPSKRKLWALYVDPASVDRLLASDGSRVYFSSDGASSFREVFEAPEHVLAGAVFQSDHIVAATSVGLLGSRDGGETFALEPPIGIPDDEAMVSFTAAAKGTTVRHFAVTWRRASAKPERTGGELDTFAGLYLREPPRPWKRVELPNAVKLSFVASAGDDPTVAYAAGGDRRSNHPLVLLTTNRGETWQRVFQTAHNNNIATGWSGDGGAKDWEYGEYVLGLAVRQGDSSRAVITDLGFVHVTSDTGHTWHQAYVSPSTETAPGRSTPKAKRTASVGMEPTSVWSLTWTGRNTLFASFTDITSAWSDDGGWSWIRGGDTGLTLNTTYHAVTNTRGQVFVATSSVHDLYQSPFLTDDTMDRATGAVMQSTDAGRHFTMLEDFGHPVVYLALEGAGTILYASVVHSQDGGIYRKDLRTGERAKRLAAPPRTQGHPATVQVLADRSLVASYSARREGTRGKRGTFTESSGVFVSTDEGLTWEDRTPQEMRRWTKDLVVDPHDPRQDTWYAGVFSAGDPSGGLYRTRDRGRTWTRLTGVVQVESISISPADSEQAYVSTESEGLLVTRELTKERPTLVPVEGYPFRHPVRIFYNPYDTKEVWITSFGSGLRVHREPW
ncbi:MAG: hypothetical protein WCI05_07060 [Myxococcales bacterium]